MFCVSCDVTGTSVATKVSVGVNADTPSTVKTLAVFVIVAWPEADPVGVVMPIDPSSMPATQFHAPKSVVTDPVI
jgi:hypothetical protein